MASPLIEEIEFPGALGEKLAARLEVPLGEVAGYALLAHCFTCSKDFKSIRGMSHAMCEQGIAVLRFDFTGLGDSEGRFADTDFSSNIDDLVAAADFLRDQYQAPQLLVGHSLGGAAVLAAAARIEEVRAVATIAAISDTEHLRDLLAEKAPDLAKQETATIQLGGRRFRIKRQLLEDLAEQSIHEAIANLHRPLLIFHSPVDNVVGIDHARRIFEAASHPKSFISLDNADHLLTGNSDDPRFVGQMIGTWARRYLQKAPGERPPELEHGQTLVTGERTGMLHHITAGPHHLLADEPEDHGGSDAGPNPYELLLASLGACTGMTLRITPTASNGRSSVSASG